MMTPSNLNGCAVLIATYNGEKYLAEQLQSILSQDHFQVKVYVSDDGSTDSTLQLIENSAAMNKNLEISVRQGPKSGYAANFMSLLCADEINAEYYSFADQDDIWSPDKLSRALSFLKNIDNKIPALYCARTQLIDSQGNSLGFSTHFEKKPSFANALVQSIAGGNTMVMNKAARDLIAQTKNTPVTSHDWWSYLLVTGAGGVIFYDSQPTVLYRQHTSNLLGRNNGLKAKWHRIKLLFKGEYYNLNEQNCIGLQQYRHLLTPSNQNTLDLFCKARDSNLVSRIRGILRSGVYRQTMSGNLGLLVATLLQKV